jgi:serine/threonine protein phosphatase PrpC
VAKHFVK